MKTSTHLVALLALMSASPLFAAAEKKSPEPKQDKLRVIAGPDDGRGARFGHRVGPGRPVEKENAPFLGVETAPVSPTVATQLGLQKGVGLVVNHVVPDSPAAATLQQHDILLRLDDQILIETRQLAVLIRNRKEGEEVTLTYLRGGKEAKAKVKLVMREVPKLGGLFPEGGAHGFMFGPDGAFRSFEIPVGAPGENREEVNRVLSLIRPGHENNPVRIQIDRKPGPGYRATTINTANSNLVFKDERGSLELTMTDGSKTLVAKNAQGEQVFSGPVNTPDERKAMPADVRERLEHVENMHDVTFHAEGDVQRSEKRFTAPLPRGISHPLRSAPKPRGLFL